MIKESADRPLATLRATALADRVVLVFWDTFGSPDRSRAAAVIDGAAAPPPVVSLRADGAWEGERRFLATRWPQFSARGGRLEIVDEARRRLAAAELDPPAGAPGHDLAAALEGLDRAARARVARFVLETCRTAFRLADDPAFASVCRRLVEHIAPNPGPLGACGAMADNLMLCEAALPRELGPITSAVWVGTRGVRQAAHTPIQPTAAPRGEWTNVFLFAERAPAEAGDSLVLLGPHGVSVRLLKHADGETPTVLEWLRRAPKLPRATRDAIGAALDSVAAANPRLRALADEIDAFLPPQARGITDPAMPVGGEIELCLDDGDGVVMTGWLRDPLQLVAGVRALGPGGAVDLSGRLHRFPRPDVDKHFESSPFGAPQANNGFIARVARKTGIGRAFSLRLELVLRSGATLELAPRPRLMPPALARDAVLAAVPPDWVTPRVLADCIAPATRALHARHLATRRPPETISFGTPPGRAGFTVLVPLYRALQFLRVQYASFATDPDFAGVDLVYVLDSPEQRPEVEGLLRSLHAVFGLPCRLVVMSANFGYAAANNAGASVATGDALVLLNSDVVPESPRWLDALDGERRQGVGAVGARLLFDDGSLQHAGMYFGRDDQGDWRNRHYFKGFPREYPAAARARSVPAATGACLLVPRVLYESGGGLSEDYVVGDYEDSDLCLRLRAAGHDIRYAPAATLIHFERRSMSLSAAGGRGVASECNRLLHTERWEGAMRDAMARPDFAPGVDPAAAPVPPAPPRRPRRRRPAPPSAEPAPAPAAAPPPAAAAQ